MIRRLSSTLPAVIFIVMFLGLIGCSGHGGDPVGPATDPGETGMRASADGIATASNRYLWGVWRVTLDPSNQTWEIVPNRDMDFHLDVRYFLEQGPCHNCISFDNVIFYPNDKVKIYVGLRHPFDDPFFDGFDVRAVIILKSTLNIGGTRLAYDVLKQADGWTKLWDNPSITGDINPYIAYNEGSPRRIFEAGTKSSEWIDLDFSQTGWTFDYAVDASWDEPLGGDFPTSANMEEAYRLDVLADEDLWDPAENTVAIHVSAWDWQGYNTISNINVTAPDIFTGAKAMTRIGGSGNEATYELLVSNENGAGPGTYPMLIKATDKNNTPSNVLLAYQVGWITVIHHEIPPLGSVEITVPDDDYTQYYNITPYVYNVTAQVSPPAGNVDLEWWWTDPDEPASDPAYGESVQWELDTDPNDNHNDFEAGIYVSGLIPESFPGPNPPEEYHYHYTTTNTQGRSTIIFKVSSYGGDNYEIHVRRPDSMEEDTSPVITSKRKATIYLSSMTSSGGQSSYYLCDHSMMQTAYNPAYIDLVYTDHNMSVTYQSQLPTDPTWLYEYLDGIKHPVNHELADLGCNRFTNANVLGIALYWSGGMPAQHTALGTGRVIQVYGSNISYQNSVFIHEIGHNFGLEHVAQGAGVMEPQCTGKTKFCRASLTYLRSDPLWE